MLLNYVMKHTVRIIMNHPTNKNIYKIKKQKAVPN